MWSEKSIIYQIYPLGACRANLQFNDGDALSASNDHKIYRLLDYIRQIKKLNADTVMFNPLFESDRHGYDTRDYFNVDKRLGTNEDFKKICQAYHDEGIKIMLDGVFNHVGRGFWAFEDVLKNRENSAYRYWFYIDFNGNSAFDDHLYYEGWEGCYDLVKLNLDNNDVVEYLLSAVKFWIDEFDIDGLRLDVAYSLNHNFLKRLRNYSNELKNEFFLLGETLHGDYNYIMNDKMCHSVTNYECYKGLYSSFNSMNMFEINHSLLRQFGKEQWCLYTNKHLLSFVDNHDVTRIASILTNLNHLPLIYAMIFTMPGIPCIYYGSEFNTLGNKGDGDETLRPYFETLPFNELSTIIAALAKIHHEHLALSYGDFVSECLTNKQCVFKRYRWGKSNYCH